MNKRLPVYLTFAALVLLYVGERVATDKLRMVMLGLGGITLVAALATATLRFTQAKGEARAAYGQLLVHYGLVALACVLYFAQTKDVALVPTGRMQTIIAVLWPAVLLLGLAPAVAMEHAVSGTEAAGIVERYRVAAGARAARIVVLAVIAFAGMNYAANTWNRKVDLSYFKTTKPSEATLALVRSLTTPVEVLLFYPAANDVLDHVQTYAESVARASERVTVRVVDQALDIELAQELKVRNNGVIFIRANGRNEQIKTELELENARNALKTLDVDFHNRLIKSVRPARLAYFTAGHGELDYAVSSADGRPTLADFKSMLESQGFAVDRLSLADGLGTAIPENTTLLLIAGPTQAFLPGERDVIQAYLARGGRLMLLADPENAGVAQPIADLVDVRLAGNLVANDKNLVRMQGKGESPYYWATNSFASHASIPSLGKTMGRTPLVFIGAGAVVKKPDTSGLSVSPTLRSMADAWEDVNKNNKLDEPTEKREVIDLAVAVEGHMASAKAEGEKPAEGMRAVVVGDADLAASGILNGVDGNQIFFVDSVRWLAGEDAQVVGLTESEKDVPIVHRKEKDTVWFYGTSFLVPAAVLALGLTASRRARRVKRDVKE